MCGPTGLSGINGKQAALGVLLGSQLLKKKKPKPVGPNATPGFGG